jgi:predicted alpha/beta-hydrolase family hydrolase
MPAAKTLHFSVERAGEVSALLLRPAQAHCLLLLAHGAGAGMRHGFLEALSAELAEAGVATLRYQFPYMEQHRKAPDRPAVLTATVQSAAGSAARAALDLPLFAGGKSMGGRMTSQAAALGLLPAIHGIVFFGFPLHPPKQPGTKRADHLSKVNVPMLFLQGTRDPFAPLPSIRSVCKKLGPRATLLVTEGADHSFHVPKSSGKSDAEILKELAQATATWAKKIA